MDCFAVGDVRRIIEMAGLYIAALIKSFLNML